MGSNRTAGQCLLPRSRNCIAPNSFYESQSCLVVFLGYWWCPKKVDFWDEIEINSVAGHMWSSNITQMKTACSKALIWFEMSATLIVPLDVLACQSGCLSLCVCFQPVLLQALHVAVLQGKNSEAGTLLKKPLSWLEQFMSGKKTTQFLTAVSTLKPLSQQTPGTSC